MRVLSKRNDFVLLQFPSRKIRLFSKYCWCVIGRICTLGRGNSSIRCGKAGVRRWLGVRPRVRGSAMNPCDHPQGGGTGKTGSGGTPRTPWGKIALGIKTRNKKKYSNKYII